MKKSLIIAFISTISLSAQAQFDLDAITKQAKDAAQKGKDALNDATKGKATSSLSNDEIVRGLKDALTIGSKNSAASASQLNGYFGNPSIKIPLPQDVQMVEQKLRQVGLGSQVDKAVLNMNRAAEEAAKQAAPIFMNAITQMTITDGVNILKGNNNAATQYLQHTTNSDLMNKFRPIVQQALQKVAITQYWKPVITGYNKIPLVPKKDPNLDEYVTNKALEGLFYLVAQEELKIRKDPAARVTDILKKVFGTN